jgi:hypothetical protein
MNPLQIAIDSTVAPVSVSPAIPETATGWIVPGYAVMGCTVA